MAFQWQCPYCGRHTTMGDIDVSKEAHTLRPNSSNNVAERLSLLSTFYVCPNPECHKTSLDVALWKTEYDSSQVLNERLVEHQLDMILLPRGTAKVFPDYIPEGLRHDYVEACLIADLSPKAAATLCRRCLQGMIRDFWQVNTKSRKLWDEMKEIKEKVDPDTWSSIVALKDLGNIGAHMELDVDVIVDVEPDEARLLIELIESLFEDWYINREQRRQRNEALKAAVAAKKDNA